MKNVIYTAIALALCTSLMACKVESKEFKQQVKKQNEEFSWGGDTKKADEDFKKMFNNK